MTTRSQTLVRRACAFAFSTALAAGCVAPGDLPLEDTAGEAALAANGGVKLLLTAEWGKLVAGAPEVPARDWSGSFRISAGTLSLETLIDFEPPKDRVRIGSRSDVVTMISLTANDSDGLEAVIEVPADTPSFVFTYLWHGYPMWSVTVDTFEGASAMLTHDDGNAMSVLVTPLH